MSAPLNLIQFIGAVELGLIYSLVVIGVYLSFRTLQFPDMTVDGSFPLGAAVAATLITTGVNPYAATFAAVLAGAGAGVITAWLSTHLRMMNLLAGILSMMDLYSVNLRIMGRPNIALLGEKTFLSGWLGFLPNYLSLGIISIAFAGGIYWFLSTRLGLAIRATGSNPKMGRAQGINDRAMITVGLSTSNALVALGGALFAQVHGFADVTNGLWDNHLWFSSSHYWRSIIPHTNSVSSHNGLHVGRNYLLPSQSHGFKCGISPSLRCKSCFGYLNCNSNAVTWPETKSS